MKFLSLVAVVVLFGIFGDTSASRDILQKHIGAGRIFKAQRVTTFTDYVFSTKTIFPQCVNSVAASSPCTGRKRRRRRDLEFPIQNIDTKIENTQNVEGTLDIDPKADIFDDRKQKFGAFTIWTTTRTTETAVVKFTDTSTTLSLIYFCTGANVDFPSEFSCLT